MKNVSGFVSPMTEQKMTSKLAHFYLKTVLPILEDIIPLSKEPYWKASSRLVAMKSQFHNNSCTSCPVKMYASIFRCFAMHRARLQVTQAALGCHVYKQEHGQFPDKLEALVPAILKDIDLDPFTGKPLIYKRTGKGFIIYSVGQDGKDNGGKKQFSSPGKEYDIVWEE